MYLVSQRSKSVYLALHMTRCVGTVVLFIRYTSNKKTPRFIHRSTAAIGSLPIERASKTDTLTTLAVYQHQYSNTNLKFQFIKGRHLERKKNKIGVVTLHKRSIKRAKYHNTTPQPIERA